MPAWKVCQLKWDGDILVVSVGYGGCERGREFISCWDETWDRAIPPGTRVQLSHEAEDEMCMMWIMEDIRLDVSTIITTAEEAMGTDPFIIRVADQSIEYRF